MYARCSYRDRVNIFPRNPGRLDADVPVLLILLAVDVVDGVMLHLVRRKEGNLKRLLM